MRRFIFLSEACHSFGAASLVMSQGAEPEDWHVTLRRDGGGPGPESPKNSSKHSDWMARMVERHCWFRVLLHLAVILRRRRNVRWHLNCIWREFHELLDAK